MTEYIIIEAKGIVDFNKALGEKLKQEWIPWMSHYCHLDKEGNSVYSIALMKPL